MSVYFLSFSFALMSHAHGCGLEGRASLQSIQSSLISAIFKCTMPLR